MGGGAVGGGTVWRRVGVCVGLAPVTCCVVAWARLQAGDNPVVWASQLAVLQPWMVMGLGMCMQSRGLSGSAVEGPMQDTVRVWIPLPQGSEH